MSQKEMETAIREALARIAMLETRVVVLETRNAQLSETEN